MKELFSILSAVIFSAGFIPYYISIFKGETKPQMASWGIWALLDIIAIVAMSEEGVITGHILAALICASLTFLLSLKYGEFKWDKTNTLTLIGAAIGIIFWVYFKSSFLGLALNMSVQFLASFPTFVSAKNYPEKENLLAWFLFWLSCIPAILAASFTVSGQLQPITFLLVESIVVYLLLTNKNK